MTSLRYIRDGLAQFLDTPAGENAGQTVVEWCSRAQQEFQPSQLLFALLAIVVEMMELEATQRRARGANDAAMSCRCPLCDRPVSEVGT